MLPTAHRLRTNRDFRLIYARGRSYAHPVVVLYVMQRTHERVDLALGYRVGFVVSKKQGGAVVRNRIKRRLREAIRGRLPELKAGPYDLALIGRSRARHAAWPEIDEAVELLLKRANLLPDGRDRSRQDRRDAYAGEDNP